MKNCYFPLEDFERLIIHIGWESLDKWIEFLDKNNKIFEIVSRFYGKKFKDDWMWGLILPFFSYLHNLNNSHSYRKVIGLSALPGTGKTTLGIIIKELSLLLDIKVSVISLDDFYLTSEEMEKAIKGNPWNVPRGFPGTHAVKMIQDKILAWKESGIINFPVFDKSLRSGFGDRSHWVHESSDFLILEGWFLGTAPTSNSFIKDNKICPPLTKDEIIYRMKIQNELNSYLNIWKIIDKIWHVKPEKFYFMNEWKINQEKEMLLKKGNALVDKNLCNFLRMLNTSIPSECFEKINSDFLFKLDQNRRLIWVGLH